jgi:hypothetical protein
MIKDRCSTVSLKDQQKGTCTNKNKNKNGDQTKQLMLLTHYNGTTSGGHRRRDWGNLTIQGNSKKQNK